MGCTGAKRQKYDCGVDKIDANDGEPASANNSIQEEILQLQLRHNQLATSLSMTMEISVERRTLGTDK